MSACLNLIDYSGCSDNTLCELACKQHSDAVSELIKRYMPMISFQAYSIYKNCTDTDDLIQEGLIAFIRSIYAFDSQKKIAFKTFASSCIRNAMLNFLISQQTMKKKSFNHTVLLQEDYLYDNVFFHSSDPLSLVVMKESISEFRTNMESLLSNLELRSLALYLDGYSYEEIALMLSASIKAIGNALQRVRRKIRSVIDSEQQ